MKPFSGTLSNLIVLAEEIVTRPALGVAHLRRERLAEIASEVRHAEARPADGVRTTNAAVVMITALEQCSFASEAESLPWLMIAGAALPLLRKDAFVAFRTERAQGAQ